MSDNSVQNDQENRYANNKLQSSPTRSLYSHDVHSIKDRILQETQETVKTNTDFNSNPLRSIQIYLKQIEDTSQDDKNFDNQELQKRSDKGDKQNLLNQISPSTFATKDISYRIVNEILNTQNPNRSHFKAKPVSRKAENNNHSSPVAESNENAIKLFKSTVFKDEKNVFDENEELKSLQDKIDEITQKLQTKKQQLEENKKHYDAENNDVEKTDRILKEKQSCLQETFHGNSSKNLLNEKSNFNIYKDRLKQLRADLQFYEGEILKLKNTIEKQERDTFNIEQKISKGFIAQIQDLEDAIISIESQKLGIYSKLSEAMMTHNQKLEQKAMLKEDLSSRLLQRADLVAQREDLEQLVETVKIVSQIEFEFSKIALKYQEQINEINQRIQELKYKEDSLKQDLKKVECIEQKKKNQNCTQTGAKDIQWENLKKLENLLEEKLKEMDIPFWKQFEKVCDEEHQNFEKEGEEDNQKINQKLKILTLKVWEDEIITLIKENIIQKDQPNEIDDQQIVSINDIIKWKNKAETEEFLKLYSEYFLKIQETINEDEKNIKENEPFDFEDLKVNLSQIQHEIQDTLNQKEMLYNDFLQRKEEMEQEYLKEIEGTGLIFNMDENVQDKSRDFLNSLEVHRDKVLDQLMNLQMELNYFEETIKNNTEVVDEKILPLIHDLLPEIEEGSVLISALKKQQILLLETEDEVTGQLNYILEQRDQKILRIKEKHKFPSVYSTKELVDMKKIFEAKAEPLREEISNLEHRIIENDKISTVVLIEQRKLQKELNQVDQELMKIHTIRKPIISNMKTQIESVDKEIRDLEKFIEQLEIHKLTLEQRFIEKNYLSQESYQNNILLVNPPKEKYFTSNFDRKDLNEINNQSGFEEIQKEKNYEPLDFATQQIQGFRDEEISSQKLDLSPINRSPESSEDQSKNLKKHDICELKDFSQSFPVKDFVSTINCFSPVDFKDFEGSHQNKIRTPQRKALNREKGEESQKDETSYLRNYKKKLIQKHVHSKANLDQNKNAILETRTKSLPQPFYSAFTNSKNDAPVVFAKYTSPKEFDVNLKFTNDAYGKNYLNTQNATKYQNLKDFKSQSKHLNPLNTVMTKNSINSIQKQSKNLGHDESVGIFSPKMLNLNINSLKVCDVLPGVITSNSSLKGSSEQPLVNKETRKYQIHFSGDKMRSNSSFLEERYLSKDKKENFERYDDNHEKMRKSKKRSLSVETSIYLDEPDAMMIIPNKIKSLSAVNSQEIYEEMPKVHKILDENGMAPAKELNFQEEELVHRFKEEIGIYENEDGFKRPKFKNLEFDEKEYKFKPNENRSDENSRREERGYLNIEDLDIKEKDSSLENLGSPKGGRIYEKYLEVAKDMIDLRIKGLPNDLPLNEMHFFETIKPLIQGNLLYKKFTNYQSLKRTAFDPLLANIYPPEVCGYGVRSIRLHPNLDKIEIRQTSKLGIEQSIPIDSILRPVVPQITMDILRVQKKIIESHHLGFSDEKIQMAEIFGDLSTKALLAKRGVNNLNNGLEKYLTCSYYSFSILLEKNGKVEFVASSYSVFKEWINGINMLLKYKKQLLKLRYKLKIN